MLHGVEDNSYPTEEGGSDISAAKSIFTVHTIFEMFYFQIVVVSNKCLDKISGTC